MTFLDRRAELRLARDILNPLVRLFRSLGRDDVPMFFLALDPQTWAVRFSHAASEAGDEGLAQRLRSDSRAGLAGARYANLGADQVHQALVADIDALVGVNGGWSENELFRAGLAILEAEPLGLGASTPGDSRNWAPAQGTPHLSGRALLRFQDALDFAAASGEAQDRVAALRARSADNTRYEAIGDHILCVPAYVERSGLVTPQNHHVFLAEYLYYRHYRSQLTPNSPIDFYLLPIRGFGQWRASADWLDVGVVLQARLRQIVHGTVSALDNAYSRYVLARLYAALSRASTALDDWPIEGSWRAFAELFWADEIAFFLADRCVHHARRDDLGTLTIQAASGTPPPPTASSTRGSPYGKDQLPFLVVSRADEEGQSRSTVHLDLRAIGTVFHEADSQALSAIDEIFGFDRVEYKCRLISADGVDEQLQFALAEHLYRVVEREVQARRDHLYAELAQAVRIFSTLTHEIRSLFQKHFLNLRYDLGREPSAATIQQTVHAWDRIHAAVEVAYLFAKAHTSREFRADFIERFRDPLAGLQARGALRQALTFVAERVYRLEGVRLMKDGLKVDGLDSAESVELSPIEFASCYVLAAEPIRNLMHHVAEAEASWRVEEDDGLTILLDHSYPQEKSLPTSLTFEAFGTLLEHFLPKCSAGVERAADGLSIRWFVRLSSDFLRGG